MTNPAPRAAIPRLRRVPDWEARLALFHAEGAARRFAWGRWDCALAAADWVYRCTGHDFATAFRGRYDGPTGAAREILANGYRDLTALADWHLPRHDAVAMARRGDVVLVRMPDAAPPALAVVAVSGLCWLGWNKTGAVTGDLADIEIAWRVG